MNTKYKITLSEIITPNKPKEVRVTIPSETVWYPLIPRVGDKVRYYSYWWVVKEVFLYPSEYANPPCVKVEFHSFGDFLSLEQLD